ncbi:MAG: prephenate dehydrogenase [Chloroflexota bacterium]|nr:prephenate dehydrogenase [Chloroflexota bacterium]
MNKHKDKPPFRLSQARIAIIGLGLMGGSLAMALRNHCRECLAVDPDPETLKLGHDNQVVDRASADPTEILPYADVIVLAAPIHAIIEWIQRLPELKSDSAMVIDLGSTKVGIYQALEKLPARFDPIGGHPMTGKETSGLAHAQVSLYQDAIFALTPLPRTSANARDIALEIVRAVGASPLWLNPATHDYYVAATSHIPYLISAALALSTPPEVASLIGPGFRSSTRLAGSGPGMMTDILLSNRSTVLDALARFRQQLDWLEGAITNGNPDMVKQVLTRSQTHRKLLLDRNKKF